MTIVSHHYRFIFLRSRKTASTSIEFALLPHLGRRDLIATSTGVEPLHHPWWNTTNRTTVPIPREVDLKARLGRLGVKRFQLYKHEPAEGVRRIVGEDIWKQYFKFSVERHPYDRVLSLWQYRRHTRDHNQDLSLGRWLTRAEKAQERGDFGNRSNWPIYAIGDDIVADRVLKWESLEQELSDVLKELGVGEVGLGRHKSGVRGEDASVESLTPRQRKRIAALYRREFEAFDYPT